MTKFLLIRHALTDSVGKRLSGRTPGIRLNEEGIKQAEKLAERLADIKLEAIYSSPLERAMETAFFIAKPHGLEVKQSDNFLEVDFGRWTNLTLEELRSDPVFNLFNSFRSGTRIPGGELMYEAQLRIISGLRKISDGHPGKIVTVVSHADMIRSAIAWSAGIHIDMMTRLEVSPASLSVLEFHEHTIRIISMNDTGNHSLLNP